MSGSKLSKEIIKDITSTTSELRNMGFLRDENGVAQYVHPGNLLELTFHGKNDSNSIMYDKHISCEQLMAVLLKQRQYTFLLYDKSIIQAEFLIEEESIIKERLIFIKKHNRIWEADEINTCDASDEDWFSEEAGIPIIIRIDYDPKEHKDGIHASSHLTLSNHESCRIPMKEAVTFSEFIRFILFHFYDLHLPKAEFRLTNAEEITETEKKQIHMYWK